MLTPAYKLTLGDKVVDTTDEPQASTVVALEVALDMDTPADRFALEMGEVGGFQPEREDEAVIELGYEADDELTQVMEGSVVRVTHGLETTRADGESAAHSLLRTFVDETFEEMTAGEIVRDLAGRAGVEVARAEDGIEFPAYVVDGRRDVYRHLRDLADLCGFDLYVDADGELVFERFAGGRTTHVLEYAQHVLSLSVLDAAPAAGRVEAFGESPGAGRGDESWAWLTKDFGPRAGSAGSGEPPLLLTRPALRTATAAQTAADALQTALERRRLRGRVLILGRPQVRLGDTIRLREVPEEELNGLYQVRAVSHSIDKSDGFTTAIRFVSLGEGA